MTRETVEKAVSRMKELYTEFGLLDPFYLGNDYEEAFIRALMEFDSIESFDYETRKFFVEDETEWKQIKKRTAKEVKCVQKFTKKLIKHMDELEKEETK